MRRIVVADDLTGASDAGAAFAKRGARTTVWLDASASLREVESSDVVVVDMDSRAAHPEAAYRRMRAFLDGLEEALRATIVKKMDSTLRGNLGPELRALLEARPSATAIVCPAYPKNQRTVVDGRVFVAGVAVDRTDFARDLFSPVRDARVAAQIDEAATSLPLATVRAGTAALQAALAQARRANVRVMVADAQTDDDLHAIAALSGPDVLWVGSAGLLEELDIMADVGVATAPALPAARGPVVLLIGSRSEMSQRQIHDYAAHGVAVVLDPAALLHSDRTVDIALEPARSAFAAGADVLVALASDAAAVSAGSAGILDTSHRLRAAFVAATEAFWHGRRGATIVLSGGDIARTCCESSGIRGMTILSETAPGIPLSRAIGADLFLVTKAGGFGHPGTYRDILATLHPQVRT